MITDTLRAMADTTDSEREATTLRDAARMLAMMADKIAAIQGLYRGYEDANRIVLVHYHSMAKECVE